MASKTTPSKRTTRASRTNRAVNWTSASELSMMRSSLDMGEIAPDEGDEVLLDGRSGQHRLSAGSNSSATKTHPLSLANPSHDRLPTTAIVQASDSDASPFPRSPSVEFARKCEEAATQYIENCKRFDIIVDPSVVIALKTGWSLLQPSRRFTEGSMLPLLGILDNCDTITKLKLTNITMQDSRFRLAGNGNSNARVLRYILERNIWVEELDLSNTGLDDDGVMEICEGIKENHSLKKLNLSSNHFGEAATRYLSEAMQINRSIQELDMSRNALGFNSINQLLCVCKPRDVNVHTFGNYVFEEILNSVSHGVAFIGSVVGSVILMSDAADIYKTDYHFWACALYSFALMFLFLSSCLFHSFFMLPTTSRILQILDHIGIYFVIAGSYSPFCLIALHHHTSARVLLTLEWIAAFLGCTFCTFADFTKPTTTLIELIIFLAMGCGFLVIWPLFIAEIQKEALWLLFIGGAFYVIGIFFFIAAEWKPIFHAIWHLFVVAAAATHWFCVYFYVVQVSLDPLQSPTKAAVGHWVDSVDSIITAVEAAVHLNN